MTARREARRQRRRRRRLVAAVALSLIVAAAVIYDVVDTVTSSTSNASLRYPTLSAPVTMATRLRIVALARQQVGYTTDPSNTYCNTFSAYWVSGPADCGNANRDQQWCADFAAWTWKMAGVPLVYQFINGDLNSSSASFYEWGVRHHTWHSVGSGYAPEPGDVAVYGLDAPALVAQHVAVVVSFTPGAAGPNAVNGDGDHTGFSRVEYRSDEYNADASGAGSAPLAGYVSPGTS